MTRLSSLFFFTAVTASSLHLASSWSCESSGAELGLKQLPEGSGAVCNDGTNAEYYFAPSSSPNSKTTLIYLSGGGQCSDKASCASRYDGSAYPYHDCNNSTSSSPCFMSSKDNPDKCLKGGIFADLVKTVDVVYVPYCSSDGWMGDNSFSGFEFRGANIAFSVVEAVIKNNPNTKTIVFGGGSAGGRGASALLDEVSSRLADSKIKVLGFLDSPYYTEDAPLGDFEGFQAQTVDVYNNFVKGSELEDAVVGGACKDAYKGEEWKCLFGQYRFPFISTDHVLVADQFDGWQLSHNIHDYDGIESDPSYSDEEMVSVDEFARKQHALMSTLREGTVFATACYSHHISEGDGFFNVKNNQGMSQSDVLKLLMEGKGIAKGAGLDEIPEEFECCCGD
ncbi:hypothetical protein TrVE_jg10611 [Triparma verrucosa]|uniref:Pectin acetylesterase n=1 Tax=Triparma verrucosa TaxID=1606542 RepID=A0A9W7C3V7_9STRA|nr:hypothetical protein TrVE_jg10611 [Triparma verrucosa]